MIFVVISTTGVMAFFLPYDISIISIHAILGFLFLAIILIHLYNNLNQLKKYLKSKSTLSVFVITFLLTAIIIAQPAPVQSILKLSKNTGPALDRFQIQDSTICYDYAPAETYKLSVKIQSGLNTSIQTPDIAIWLENQSNYHIKTLHASSNATTQLPFWNFKKSEYEKAKLEAQKEQQDILAVSGATPNNSFNAEDYLLPKDQTYTLLIEINQPHDQQPSLIYSVEVSNSEAKYFQTFDLLGYPSQEENSWKINYDLSQFTSAKQLINSALLTIQRTKDKL